MRKLTHQERDTINTYIKNRIDISALIEGKDISGENLNRSIISKMERLKDDISGCSFAFAKLGSTDVSLNIKLLQTKMQNCNFEGVEFIGTSWIRNCDARNCNFKDSNISKVSFQNTDFRDCTICGTILRVGTRDFLGTKFNDNTIGDWAKNSLRLKNKND